jgi:hypothetical protein
MRDKNQPTKNKAGHKKPHMYTKRLGKLSPIGIILAACFITGAILIGSMFTSFFVQTKGDIQLNGEMRPLFYYDTLPFNGQYCNVSIDYPTMTAGDTLTKTHIIENADEGYWSLVWDLSQVNYFYNDPSSIYYGFNFTVMQIDGSPLPEPFTFGPEQTRTVLFTYSLHDEFVEAPVPLDFNISLTIERSVGILAKNDTFLFSGSEMDFYPMENDMNSTEHPLHIDSITAYSPQYPSTTVSLVDDHIHVYRSPYDSTWNSGSLILEYTIHDSTNAMESTATITITKQ